jgi:5'-deoxynucleotidase YfbR-like HD superfamily hydrolase
MVMTGDGQMTVADLRGWGTLSAKHGEEKAAEIMDANGRLLAASHEMAEALRELIDLKDNVKYSNPGDYQRRKEAAWQAARDAIEKAGG